jgi:hopanoid biosynthesis associated protein HpnK
MKTVIFTADDFGLVPEVNAAVAQAHRNGVLTAASLMIGAPAAAEAVELARAMPRLGVGLHVVVADGMPVLPPEQIPDLVDGSGRLRDDLVGSGVRWFFLPRVREQLAREIAAQFDAFSATGLICDHVNAHNHLHLHPTVLTIVMAQARAYGVRHMRLPYERGHLGLAPWMALMRARLRRNGFRFNDRLAGLDATGHMTEACVLGLLETVGDGATEFYFHPATQTTPQLEREAPGYDRRGELAALMSAQVAARVQSLGLKAGVFRDLT